MAFYNIFSKSEKGKKTEERIRIIVDNREKQSLVASELVNFGADIIFEQLEVGDYIVNGGVIERKTVSDLKSSIIDKRIIGQLDSLRNLGNGLLLIEGDLDELYSGKGMHENAVRGFLLSVVLGFGVPVIFSRNPEESAKYILVLAKKKEKPDGAVRGMKREIGREEQVQFILEGFPGIGPVAAKKLVEKFGSLKGIFSASEAELAAVLGKKAEKVWELLNFRV